MVFKLVFGVAFLWAVTLTTVMARRAAARHGGSANQLVHEARGLIAVRAVLGIVFYASLAAWLFDLQAARWMHWPLPEAARWAGVVIMATALAFYTASFVAIGTNYRGGVGLYERHELVTSGPYALIRHPIYASFITIMCAVALLSANWLLGLSGLVLVTSVALVRVPIEEAELSDRFGAAWDDYVSR